MNSTTLVGLLPLVFIVGAFYLLLIKPARGRAAEAAVLAEAVRVGTEVMTTSGLYATVVAVDEESVTLATSPGVTSRWAKAAIGRIVNPPGTAGGGEQTKTL